MSIELKEAAQQVLKELGEARKIVRASSSRQLAKDWDRRATDALANLRTAIQQAEAQPPATGELVLFIHPDTFAMNNAHVGAWKPGHELTGYIPLYTRPAPSVPMTDEQISLEAHNADDRDWNDLRFRRSWHEGFLEGARFAEAHHGITAQGKKEKP